MKIYYKLKMIIVVIMLNNCIISNRIEEFNDDVADFALKCGGALTIFASQCGADYPAKSEITCLAILDYYSKNCE